MRAYYFDNVPGDQRLPHDCVPSRPVSDATLAAINVKYWAIPVAGHEPKIDVLAKEQGYKNRDLINVSKEGMGEVRADTACCRVVAHLGYGADLRAEAEDVLRRVRPGILVGELWSNQVLYADTCTRTRRFAIFYLGAAFSTCEVRMKMSYSGFISLILFSDQKHPTMNGSASLSSRAIYLSFPQAYITASHSMSATKSRPCACSRCIALHVPVYRCIS